MFLLDTDHVSLVHRPSIEGGRLRQKLLVTRQDDVYVSIVSFQEQTLGANSFEKQAKSSLELERAYRMYARLLDFYSDANVETFDQEAIAKYEELKKQKLRIGAMDLRIAATALSRNWTLVTRNMRDFERVPDLKLENWTA